MSGPDIVKPAGALARFVRLVRLARSHGKMRALCRLIRRMADHRCCRAWLRFNLVECFTVRIADLPCDRSIPRAYLVRRADEDDLPVIGPFFGDPERVRRRLARGDVCLVTLAKDKVSAGVWLVAGPGTFADDFDALFCVAHFPEGTCWSFDGKGTRWGAWGSLMAQLPQHLKQLGVREVFTLIDYDNRESIDGHLSLGYDRIGMIASAGILGLRLRVYKTPGSRWRLMPGRIGNVQFGGGQ